MFVPIDPIYECPTQLGQQEWSVWRATCEFLGVEVALKPAVAGVGGAILGGGGGYVAGKLAEWIGFDVDPGKWAVKGALGGGGLAATYTLANVPWHVLVEHAGPPRLRAALDRSVQSENRKLADAEQFALFGADPHDSLRAFTGKACETVTLCRQQGREVRIMILGAAAVDILTRLYRIGDQTRLEETLRAMGFGIGD